MLTAIPLTLCIMRVAYTNYEDDILSNSPTT